MTPAGVPEVDAQRLSCGTIIASELLYARLWLSEAERAVAIQRWNIH
jgi:hypothetical protein